MSIIGLLLYTVGFIGAFLSAEQATTVSIGVFQLFGLLFIYGFIHSIIGIIYSIRYKNVIRAQPK